jgi:hypothetical protein
VSISIDWQVNESTLPLVGVFGRYASLTITYSGLDGVNAGTKTVLAQDMLSDGPPTDVTARVQLMQGTTQLSVHVPGQVIDEVGTASRSNAKDMSDPGLVLVVKTDDAAAS